MNRWPTCFQTILCSRLWLTCLRIGLNWETADVKRTNLLLSRSTLNSYCSLSIRSWQRSPQRLTKKESTVSSLMTRQRKSKKAQCLNRSSSRLETKQSCVSMVSWNFHQKKSCVRTKRSRAKCSMIVARRRWAVSLRTESTLILTRCVNSTLV